MKAQITLTLDDELLRQIEIIAMSQGISIDDAFEESIRNLLLQDFIESTKD
jgi:hypothetical protein